MITGICGAVLCLGIGGSILLNNTIENNKIKKTLAIENPYDLPLRTLHKDTIQELQKGIERKYIVSPQEVADKIANKETFYLYVFKPNCTDCVEEAQIHMAKMDNDVPYVEVNGLEYAEFNKDFDVERIPTVISYIEGQELTRMSGKLDTEDLEQYFEDSKKIMLTYLNREVEEEVAEEATEEIGGVTGEVTEEVGEADAETAE